MKNPPRVNGRNLPQCRLGRKACAGERERLVLARLTFDGEEKHPVLTHEATTEVRMRGAERELRVGD